MILSTALILLITIGIGLPITLLLTPRLNKLAILGLSYLLGIGIYTLLMFAGNIFGIRFSLLNELGLLFLLLVPLVFFAKRRMKNFFIEIPKAVKNSKLEPVEKVMLGVLVFLIVTSFINTFYWPVYMWDSIVLYDFRGHVFAGTGYMKEAFIDSYYYGYPLLTSLAHSIIYLAGGKYPQFLYSAFYLSLGLIFYGFLREFASWKLSLLFSVVLLITGPLFYHSLFSYTNLTFTVYLAMGAISIFLWDKKKDSGYLILSALLIGLSTWVRSTEPFWAAVLLIVFLVSIYRKKVWNFALYSLFFFPIREVWKVFQNYLYGNGASTVTEISGYGNMFSSIFDMNRWGQVITYLYKYVVTPWGGIFAAFVVAVIALFLIKKQKDLFLIYFIVFVFLAVLILGTFSFSVTMESWYAIGDAAERLSMLFYPLFIFCIALVLSKFVKIKK